MGSQSYRSISTDTLIDLQGSRSIPTVCKPILHFLEHTCTVYSRQLFAKRAWMIATCTLTYFLPFVSKQQILKRLSLFLVRGHQLCQFLWTYWQKENVSIGNFTVLLQVTIIIDTQYTNLWTDKQAYSISCFTGLLTCWSKQQMSIDNFTYLLVKQ